MEIFRSRNVARRLKEGTSVFGFAKGQFGAPPSERVHFAGGLADNNNVINININVAAVLSSGANAFFAKTRRFVSDFSFFFAPKRAERSTLQTTLTIG